MALFKFVNVHVLNFSFLICSENPNTTGQLSMPVVVGCPVCRSSVYTGHCVPPISPAAGGGALGGGGSCGQAWGLYRSTHGADCELCLGAHDVCGLDVAVIHGVLKCGPHVCVLVASIAVEWDFGSSPENRRRQ